MRFSSIDPSFFVNDLNKELEVFILFSSWMNSIRDKINYNKEKQKDDVLLESIQKAQKEWNDKENYFDFATDTDLVDFAIYDIEASKRKYAYLLKLIKEKNK